MFNLRSKQKQEEKLKNRIKKQEEIRLLLEEIRKEISDLEEDKQIFKEVIEHIEKGGVARGIVWDYSQYMTKEDALSVIIIYDETIEDLKILFGEIVKAETSFNILNNVNENISLEKRDIDNLLTDEAKKAYISLTNKKLPNISFFSEKFLEIKQKNKKIDF